MKMTYFADLMDTQDYMKKKRETKRQINAIYRWHLFITFNRLVYIALFIVTQ